MIINTVTELTTQIKVSLENQFRTIAVKGEISNFKRQSSGHLYFSLKDSGAQISVIMFKNSLLSLKRFPKDGDKVILHGDINVYPARGNYQIIVRKLEYDGLGDYLIKLEELKRKINNLGWFKAEHKKKIPLLPKKIGVITSPTGAVIRDVINVLRRRHQGFHLILNPVNVQGDKSAKDIVNAIEDFNKLKLVDVIILCRGGGSIEDLWSFNEEIVAKAIFESKIPIISAVGHETDHTIADYVADMRAPTPSAAAELVIAEKEAYIKNIDKISQLLNQKIISIFYNKSQHLDYISEILQQKSRLITHKRHILLERYTKIIEKFNPINKILNSKNRLEHISDNLYKIIFNKKTKDSVRLNYLTSMIDSTNPQNLLKKGYSIIFYDNCVVKQKKQINLNNTLNIKISDGEIKAEVIKI